MVLLITVQYSSAHSSPSQDFSPATIISSQVSTFHRSSQFVLLMFLMLLVLLMSLMPRILLLILNNKFVLINRHQLTIILVEKAGAPIRSVATQSSIFATAKALMVIDALKILTLHVYLVVLFYEVFFVI